jgi:hypothetical protein
MESGFVGLIFSCFNTDQTNQTGRIQLLAFQSKECLDGGAKNNDSPPVRWEQINIPISIVKGMI